MFSENLLIGVIVVVVVVVVAADNQNHWMTDRNIGDILKEYAKRKTELVTLKCVECRYENDISLDDFANLKTLRLRYTNFTDGVTDSFFKKLTSLEHLDLSGTQSVPDTLTLDTLPKNLRVLQLNGLKFKNLFAVCNFENIETLELSATEFSSFELSDTCKASKLRSLDLSATRIPNLEKINWTNLKSLAEFYLSDCDTDKLPDFGSLSALEQLYLSKNKIAKFENIKLDHLLKLDLSSNSLTAFDRNNFRSLESLMLANNRLESFKIDGLLPHLKHLKLNNNLLETFELKSIQDHLEDLNLNNNQLKKFGLKEMSGMPKLKTLNLLNNNLLKLDEVGHICTKLNVRLVQSISNEEVEGLIVLETERLERNLTALIREESRKVIEVISGGGGGGGGGGEKGGSGWKTAAKWLLYVVLIGLFGWLAFMLWQNCTAQNRLIGSTAANGFDMTI